jgi:hypothetical protein
VKLSALRGKARRNTLEVEHILAAAKAASPGLGGELRRLSKEFDWPMAMHLPDGRHVVPLGKWAEIAGSFSDGGFPALAPLAKEPENAGYIIGLLEEIRSQQAVNALLDLFAQIVQLPETSPEIALRLVRAFNVIFGIKGALLPSEDQAMAVRAFLMSCYRVAMTDRDRALVVYALRGVGDESTLAFLAGIEDFAPPHDSARPAALREICRRLWR